MKSRFHASYDLANFQALREDAKRNESTHDFGKNVLPDLIGRRRIMAYDFVDENKKEIRYWRDVGTIDAYYEANMDLVSASPHFNLYETGWPIRTMSPSQAPATFLSDEAEHMGMAVESLVSPGCIISGCRVLRSVLSPGVRINSHCEIDSSIVLENARIGPCSRIRRAIIDANVEIPANTEIGWDREADRARFERTSGRVEEKQKLKAIPTVCIDSSESFFHSHLQPFDCIYEVVAVLHRVLLRSYAARLPRPPAKASSGVNRKRRSSKCSTICSRFAGDSLLETNASTHFTAFSGSPTSPDNRAIGTSSE